MANASATITEALWGDRSITFNVSIENSTATCTLTVSGDTGKWYATGPTTCYVGSNKAFEFARTTSGFPAVVGTQSKTLNVAAGQTYECSFETAIYTSSKTKKTFSITASAGGGGQAGNGVTISSASGGDIGSRMSYTLKAPSGRPGGEGVSWAPRYGVDMYIKCGEGAPKALRYGIILDTNESKTISLDTIPEEMMDSLGESSTKGTAQLICHSYEEKSSVHPPSGEDWADYYDDERYSWDDGETYGNISISIPRQTLTINTVTATVYVPPEYSSQLEYKYGDLVTYQNVVYICRGDTVGAWDPTKWVAYALPNVPLANRTLFEISWSGAVATRGSYISRVRIEYARMSEYAENPSEDGTYVTGVVPASGYVSFKVTVFDARGFQGSASVNSIDILAYERPNIESFLVSRYAYDPATGTGRADDKGTYAYAGGRFSVTSLGGVNTIKSARISNAFALGTTTYYELPIGDSSHNVTSGQYYIFRYYNGSTYSPFDTTRSYYIKLEVTDTLDMTSEKIVILSTEPAILDLLHNGKGLAIGKVAEREGVFEVAMDMEINNQSSQVSVNGEEIWLGSADGSTGVGADGVLIDTQHGIIQVKSTGVDPTSYKQVRNIYIMTNDPDDSIGEPGDIWIKVGGNS